MEKERMETLRGRIALVTGASRGLGAAIALELGAQGAKVAVNYFANREGAERVCDGIRETGGEASPFCGDVRDAEDIRRVVDDVKKTFGDINIAVINATGPQPFLSIGEQTWQSYLDQFEFFVKSPLLILQQVLSAMVARGFGRIIQIGSEVVEVGNPRFANYVAAKAAQLGQTRSWARELAPTGVTVNLVAPGWIPTERHAGVSQEEIDAYVAMVPMKRMGIPKDVAKAVAYLASDDAGFITGQKISVNGGNALE
jgi:3-oxoacyl-[acyl-carrier protein] reductase